MTTFKGNRRYPNPVTVTDDPRTHTLALQHVIEALNVGQRRTRDIANSFVRLHELVDVGLIEVVNGQLKLTNLGETIAAGGASALADLTDVDLTGLADGDTLVWNSATSMWEPGAGGGGGGLSDLYDQTLNNLADVAFYQPREGDVLTYSSSLGMWVSDSPPALSAHSYSEQSSNFTAVSNRAYLLTADNIVVTLPASPSNGDYVILTSGPYAANCSVDDNGKTIMGFTDGLELDGTIFTIKLVYVDSTGDWVIAL